MAARSLIGSLRQLSPQAMAALIRKRPDLAEYAGDLSTLARRCATTESVRLVWPRLDEAIRRFLTALAAGFGADDPRVELGRTVARVRQEASVLGLAWGNPPRPVRGVTVLLGPFPAGLAPDDPDAPSASQVAWAMEHLDEAGRRILEKTTWSSPIGQYLAMDDGAVRRFSHPSLAALVEAGLVQVIGPGRVLVPRNVTLALRGGLVFPPLPPSPVGPGAAPRQIIENALAEDTWVYLTWANDDGTTSSGIVRVLTVGAGTAYLVHRAGPRFSVPLVRLVAARPGPPVVVRGEPGSLD